MEDRRIFVIGDIHGCYLKLRKMLTLLDYKPGQGDLLILLGDYIDRGPQNFEVVETLAGLAERCPEEVIPLMGNHESMFLDFITGQAEPQLAANGLANTIQDYCRSDKELTAAHLLFYRRLHLWHETETHIFVHAGLAPGKLPAEQNHRDLLWIRDDFLNSDYDFGKTVVFGHTPFKEPFVAPGRLGLDTGAVFGGPLTAAILPEMRFVFAD